MTMYRNRRVLLLALLLATVSAVLAYQLVSSQLRPAPVVVEVTPEAGEPVLVSARMIPEGTTLVAGDVKIAYVAAEAKGERALTGSDQALGKVALQDISEGEQILAGTIGETTAPVENTFAREVPVGMRAVTIAVEETVGVGGFVQPGDRVDVIAGFDLKPASPPVGGGQSNGDEDAEAEGDGESDEDDFPVAELLLQDVDVLAVGQSMESQPAAEPVAAETDEAAAATEPAGPVTRPEATSVTLLVDPAEALRLLLAVQSDGTFRLLLRAPGDASVTELPPALIMDGPVAMEPFELVGSNLAESDLAITSARFEETFVPAGGVISFEVTVQNISSQLIPAGGGGADPGHVYPRGENWETAGAETRPGVYGLALTSETAGQVTFPWRWDLGQDLAPGESVTITGGVQAPNTPGEHRWWFGLTIQPGTVIEDGVSPTEITIEPVSALVVVATEADLREEPWPDAPVVHTEARGAEVDVLEYRDGWFLVRAGDTDGWVAESEVVNSELPAAASVADAARQTGEIR